MTKFCKFLVWGFDRGPYWLMVLLLLSLLVIGIAWVVFLVVMFSEFGPLAGCVSLFGPPAVALAVAFEHWRLTEGRD